MNKTELEKIFADRAKEIFTKENIGAISYYISNLVPDTPSRIQVDEFQTIVAAARFDGMRELVSLINNDINNQP